MNDMMSKKYDNQKINAKYIDYKQESDVTVKSMNFSIIVFFKNQKLVYPFWQIRSLDVKLSEFDDNHRLQLDFYDESSFKLIIQDHQEINYIYKQFMDHKDVNISVSSILSSKQTKIDEWLIQNYEKQLEYVNDCVSFYVINKSQNNAQQIFIFNL